MLIESISNYINIFQMFTKCFGPKSFSLLPAYRDYLLVCREKWDKYDTIVIMSSHIAISGNKSLGLQSAILTSLQQGKNSQIFFENKYRGNQRKLL